MNTPIDIICVGSVLWDVIGRAPVPMKRGYDVAGRITRLPGGVALNIAMTLRGFGITPALLSVVGDDAEGRALMAACSARGLVMDHVLRAPDLPTDRYMAIEAANGLVAAIADAHSLEAAGDDILRPITHGPLGSAQHPYGGVIALDGNLTPQLLSEIAQSPLFADADLRIAPASPGKAERLLPFAQAGRGTLYVNLSEAELLCGHAHECAQSAGLALVARGAARAIVTNGDQMAADVCNAHTYTGTPRQVDAKRITGAGDTFMAAHIAAELRAAPAINRSVALERALEAAATYVSGETPK